MTDKAQIYLVSRTIDDPSGAMAPLAEACDGGGVAAVLLSFAFTDEREQTKALKTIVPVLQKAGAAVIARTSPLVAVRGGADGVHIDTHGAVQEAIDTLKPDRIVGVGGLRTRHEAMEAGERDIDYLMFGEPRADGSLPDLDTTIERAAWWAEIFAVPCVGFVHDLDNVAAMAETGAEFIGVGEAVWSHAEGPAAAIARVRAIIATTDVPGREAPGR
ncbi:thiamine-phosphate pyrophosphorylase [Pseudochelatococcus lubricantis]|uniref:Thiamine-phosphate pyrophosphorylase n=1 Tax=Pseudochelatococcus lubricantis TaxID=1538102 RepID=A0ABX0UTU3_9HYPH|nr:thiamine phosphate synthase [Pseudochelatococcus lubricantis]NIJ56388.1 thiamine-phosphate pyrophosphorylase [Pseudochelatococcus lubricantis]